MSSYDPVTRQLRAAPMHKALRYGAAVLFGSRQRVVDSTYELEVTRFPRDLELL